VSITPRTIALVVQGNSRAEARSAASFFLRDAGPAIKPSPATSEMQVPLTLRSPESLLALEELWDAQRQVYLADLRLVAGEIALNHEALPELLDDPAFRSACYRLGTLEGLPVRIYGPEGDGITWRADLEMLIEGKPDDSTGEPLLDVEQLWVVLVDIM